MEEKSNQNQELTIEKLLSLGQYTIAALENPDNEVDIKSEVLNDLKQEVIITKRFHGSIPQENAELNKMVSYFKRQEEIVDEVIQRPQLQQDIEFTAKFISSNQKRLNEILK
ncbi:MAG: hypothetical protein GY699_24160 [Desulfobacteraceae bacterium]|nr:hypothetical protein [Desulfobacteraceae bacterium]